MTNSRVLAYSIQKNIVSVYYKDMIDNPLTEGKSPEDLIALIENTDLPDIVSIKNIKTDLAKVGKKYRLIANVTYISNGEPGSRSIVFDDTEEEYIPNEEKVIFLDTKYVVIDDENGDIVLDYITE